MELQTTELRLEGPKAWRNTCTHPADDRRWRYLPVFDFVSGHLICDRCGDVLAGTLPSF